MTGNLVGSFAAGYVADRVGRRPTLMVMTFICCTASLGSAFVGSYAWYCVTRFFTGLGEGGTCCMVSQPTLVSLEPHQRPLLYW